MLNSKLIVGSCFIALLAVSACGQKGALMLPKEPAAQNRATLPQVLTPLSPASSAAGSPAASPASPASAPKR